MADEAAESRAAVESHEEQGLRESDESPAEHETLDALKAQAEENWTRYLRACAELDNLRKRSARELDNARKFGVERLVQAVLPVRDSLEAALATGAAADAQTLLDGTSGTLRLLEDALDSAGVKVIDPLGEPFDPARHEAMLVRPADDVAPDTVVEVVQKGYEVHDRVVRPARVIVSQASGG